MKKVKRVRRFVNMEKLLGIKLNKYQYKIAYNVYKSIAKNNYIHNLSDITHIPFYVKFVLALGLNYCNNNTFDIKGFKTKMFENIRRIAWRIHFTLIGKDSNELDEFTKFLISCKKRDRTPKNLPKIYDKIFPNPFFISNLTKTVKSRHNFNQTFPPTELLLQCKNYLTENKLMVKNADKNAGVCIMKKEWHDNEVYKHLHNTETYAPSCLAEYEMDMQQIADIIKSRKIKITEEIYLDSLILLNYKPASFYILPKVHKKFDFFPPGRPISSTCATINRNISALVDFIFKPIMCEIPGVLLDTTHFLILLNNIQLQADRKYVLLTYDIDSMYTNLQVNRCKNFCIEAYKNYTDTVGSSLFSIDQVRLLLNICLDYSYVQFDNEMFKQRKGIQMGNAASVSLANITAYFELETMFREKPEIVFNVRFVDDGFIILDITNIENIDSWVRSTFQHEFLTFTSTYNHKQLTFLDVEIILHNGKIDTVPYKKPMSKNLYLSFYSNHPKHLIKSLPYSQAIRLKRICSDNDILLSWIR